MAFWSRKPAKPAVLVIEDDPSVQRMLRDILAAYDFEPILASTGLQGVELAKEKLPAAILLDMNLPDASGLDILVRLKGDPATIDIPVVMATALQTGSAVEDSFARGAVGYVIKPFDGAKVIEKLRAAIKQ